MQVLQDGEAPAVIGFMATRRSSPAKAMTLPGPDAAQMRKILEIGARAPDHGKLTPWRFVAYAPAACERINKAVLTRALHLNPMLGDAEREIERTRFTRAPAVVGVFSRASEHPKIPVWEQELSAGAVCMNILIAANALGFDAQWITEWVAYDSALRQPLGIEDGEKVAGFIHIGTRTMPKTERDRPVLEDIVRVMER